MSTRRTLIISISLLACLAGCELAAQLQTKNGFGSTKRGRESQRAAPSTSTPSRPSVSAAPPSLPRRSGEVSRGEAPAQTDALTLHVGEEHCQRYVLDSGRVEQSFGVVHLSEPIEKQIVALMCHERFMADGVSDIPETSVFGRMHFAMDDRKQDPLEPAMTLVACTGSKWCDGPIAAGQMAWYAKASDSRAVGRRLQRLTVHDDVRSGFLRRYKAARQMVLKRAAELDPRRKELYRKLVSDVRGARAKHWKTHAALWRRYDELHARADAAVRNKTANRSLIRQVARLRDDYMAACRRTETPLEACLHGQLARPLTEDLVKLAIAVGDPVLGNVENDVLQLSVDRSSAAMQLYIAQYGAMKAEREKYDKYAEAKRGGLDEATLASMFGDPPPIQIDAYSSWRPPHLDKDYSALFSDKPQKVSGEVKKLQKRGTDTVIEFADAVTHWDEHDCVETNRIDRINSDGTIVYRQRCKYKKTHTNRRRIRPITVPAKDAVGLRAGLRVTAAVAGTERRGYVLTVHRHEDLVGVRGYRD